VRLRHGKIPLVPHTVSDPHQGICHGGAGFLVYQAVVRMGNGCALQNRLAIKGTSVAHVPLQRSPRLAAAGQIRQVSGAPPPKPGHDRLCWLSRGYRISNAMGMHGIRGMASVFLAFKHPTPDRFPSRFGVNQQCHDSLSASAECSRQEVRGTHAMRWASARTAIMAMRGNAAVPDAWRVLG